MLPPLGTPGADLPVRAALPALEAALAGPGAAVLVAPPGTGKTTLVPLALAGLLPGRVVVAEPRRVAARAAARRMSALLGEPPGRRVGHTVRGESTVGAHTRVEVLTTGVLVRRLQRDPELAGTAAVLLDECHERHLDTDLALAFAVDVRSVLRPELVLVAMSATAQADRLAAALGGAPVVRAEGALHDVEVVWCPPVPPLPPPGTRVDRRLLDHVAAVVRRALADGPGDVLVFLPGAGEVADVAARLAGLGVEVVPLSGRLPAAAQDAALRPGPARRVVVATALAESSLTVPGVRVVVDAGLSRVPRTDLARGLGTLVTVPVSRASAEQRAGRAGREAPGRVYRCWSAAEHERLPAHAQPEVATADLTGFVLELACWGAPGGAGLALLDPPPEAAARVAGQVLQGLGAVDATGAATPRGRALQAVGAPPRLGRALVDGGPLVGARAAAEVVAVLAEDAPAGATDDLAEVLRALRSGRDRAATARWREEVRRLERQAGAGEGRAGHRHPGPAAGGAPGHASGPSSKGAPGRAADRAPGRAADRAPGGAADLAPDLAPDLAAGLVVGLALPERLARRRSAGGTTYLMAGGTGAELAPGSSLRGAEWLAVAVADRAPGRRDARVRLAVAVDEDTAREAGAALLAEAVEVVWEDGDVRARHVQRLGAVVLRSSPVARPDPAAARAALQEGLRREGLGLLRWSSAARALRARLAACRAGLGEPWPDVSDEALTSSLDLSSARSRADLQRVDVGAALRALLPWQVAGRLDEVAPESVLVPSGSRVRVDYADPSGPVLPVRVQEVFGWQQAPLVAGRPLRLHLLSPAARVVAVTSDLASFWTAGYASVRADLRGRYPRHAWPDDPAHAAPARRPPPRR